LPRSTPESCYTFEALKDNFVRTWMVWPYQQTQTKWPKRTWILLEQLLNWSRW
jgi:hypothetical protein